MEQRGLAATAVSTEVLTALLDPPATRWAPGATRAPVSTQVSSAVIGGILSRLGGKLSSSVDACTRGAQRSVNGKWDRKAECESRTCERLPAPVRKYWLRVSAEQL